MHQLVIDILGQMPKSLPGIYNTCNKRHCSFVRYSMFRYIKRVSVVLESVEEQT